MDKQQPSPSADNELEDAPIPPRGYGQRELMAFDELFQPDMPDGKLINLYFLVEDWHTTDRRVFADAFKRVESTLLARMSGGLPDPNAGREFPIGNDDEIDKAEEAVKSGSLSHPDLLEMYSIASGSRNYIEENEELGRRWYEVLDLCRRQILQRISDHRSVEPAKSKITKGEDGRPKQSEPRIRDFDLPHRIGDGDSSGDDDVEDDDGETIREILRRLENTFRPSISDEVLLDVYLEVSDYEEPDIDSVFDEIREEVRRTVMHRMGAEDPDACCGGIPYDYPDYGGEALQFLLGSELPPEKLLFIFKLSDGSEEFPEWQAVHDLSRIRILRRMGKQYSSSS